MVAGGRGTLTDAFYTRCALRVVCMDSRDAATKLTRTIRFSSRRRRRALFAIATIITPS